jgi:uncharacterized membrane protein
VLCSYLHCWGQIISAGLGLGIYDFNLRKRSLNNLLIATLVSLFVSTLYFYISSFKKAQSELLSRTSFNIYEILIAFFGVMIAAIAMTKVEKREPCTESSYCHRSYAFPLYCCIWLSTW